MACGSAKTLRDSNFKFQKTRTFRDLEQRIANAGCLTHSGDFGVHLGLAVLVGPGGRLQGKSKHKEVGVRSGMSSFSTHRAPHARWQCIV